MSSNALFGGPGCERFRNKYLFPLLFDTLINKNQKNTIIIKMNVKFSKLCPIDRLHIFFTFIQFKKIYTSPIEFFIL